MADIFIDGEVLSFNFNLMCRGQQHSEVKFGGAKNVEKMKKRLWKMWVSLPLAPFFNLIAQLLLLEMLYKLAQLPA